jgi:hypothetical protein
MVVGSGVQVVQMAASAVLTQGDIKGVAAAQTPAAFAIGAFIRIMLSAYATPTRLRWSNNAIKNTIFFFMSELLRLSEHRFINNNIHIQI